MPKMKTKSGAKKRFKTTANGHIKTAQAGKRHGIIFFFFLPGPSFFFSWRCKFY